MSYLVYVLECADGTLYTGMTTDLERRVNEHNHSKLGAKYTRTRRPVACIYSETLESRSDALRREFVIKRLSPGKKRLLGSLTSPYVARESEIEGVPGAFILDERA